MRSIGSSNGLAPSEGPAAMPSSQAFCIIFVAVSVWALVFLMVFSRRLKCPFTQPVL